MRRDAAQPSVYEVKDAMTHLLDTRRRSIANPNTLVWTREDREAVRTLARFMALATNQLLSSFTPKAL